jgi:hypothetical protein
VDSGQTEFRPDPASIKRAQNGQLWWTAWAAALSGLAAALGAGLGSSRWTVVLGYVAAAVGLGFVAAGVARHRRLARVLRDGHGLSVHPQGLVLPGEPPLDWSGVAAVVAHRLDWAGLEVTLHEGRRVRLPAQHYGTTVDELAAAVARHMPVGDPDAAYGRWGEYWNNG